MRSLAVLALLAGCGFHVHAAGGTSDAPVGDDDAPPAHDATVDGAPDAAMIDAAPDAPPVDTDGDGVPDASDDCPADADPDQHDHDGDGRGDVCDLCPHIAEATDVDNDGDGVGDACDPRPMTAGDARLLWAGFYDASEIATWPKSGTWSVANGHLTGGSTSSSLSYIYPPTPYAHTYAETLAHYETLATPSNGVSPSAMLYTADTGNAQYALCEAAATAGGNGVYAIDVYPIGQNHFDQQTWSGTLAAGSEIMLHDLVLAGTHTCRATQGMVDVQVSQDAGPTNGVVALGTAYATVSFDYLFVVAVGP